jgi:hypothetical protein
MWCNGASLCGNLLLMLIPLLISPSAVLQTGCFCNPGACAKYLGLSHSDLVSNFEVQHTTFWLAQR